MRTLLLLLLFWPLLSPAQTPTAGSGTLNGIVVDSATGKPLIEASVSLLLARDSSMVSFGITDGDGRFSFDKLGFDTYRVLITYVGYNTRSRRIGVTNENPNANAGTIRLTANAKTLNEVEVKGERAPVTVKGDTLQFNAGSFKAQPNAVVEDVLKKLPGVEVNADGSVKAQGQDVKKILVDGKPFFGDDPKMATRNLPADIIDKIEVFDQASEQSQFSGVDDGDRTKTINITTRQDKRKGWFGQQSVAIGPKTDDDPRYSVKANINHFNNNRQISVMGMANNINQQGFTAQDMGLGSNVGSGRGGRGGGNAAPTGGGSGITQSWAGGVNYRDAWGKKIDVTASYNPSNTNTVTLQNTRRTNILPSTAADTDSVLIRNSQDSSSNENLSHRANMRLEYRLDSATTIRLIPSLSWSRSHFDNQSHSRTTQGSGLPTNASDTRYLSDGSGFSGNNQLLILHKFQKRGRSVSVNWNASLNNQETEGLNRSTVSQFLTGAASTSATSTSGVSTTHINQQNLQNTHSVVNSINVSYTEPLSMRQTLEFHYQLSNNQNTSDRRVNDFSEATGTYSLINDNLTNNFANTFQTNRGGLTWQTNRLKFMYALGLDAQQSGLRSDNESKNIHLNKTFSNLLPNALFTYNFAKNQRLRFTYRTRLNAPSVSQLQPVINNTNPLIIQKGNIDLQPEYSHNVSVYFNRFNPVTYRNLFAFVNASLTNNKIVNGVSYSRGGVQTIMPINTNGYYSVNANVSIGLPIHFGEQRVNFNTGSNVGFNQGISLIDAQRNESKNWSVGQSIGLNTNIDSKLDLNLRGNLSWQTSRFSLQPQQNTSYLNQGATFDLFYQLPLRFTVSTNLIYNHYGGKSSTINQSFTLWNAAISRQLFKQRQGEIKLMAFDLLNQNRSISQNQTATYIEEVRSNVLTQYFMLSFVYNLRKFGAGVSSAPTTPSDRPTRDFPGEGGGRRNGGFRPRN